MSNYLSSEMCQRFFKCKIYRRTFNAFLSDWECYGNKIVTQFKGGRKKVFSMYSKFCGYKVGRTVVYVLLCFQEYAKKYC